MGVGKVGFHRALIGLFFKTPQLGASTLKEEFPVARKRRVPLASLKKKPGTFCAQQHLLAHLKRRPDKT